MIETEPRQTFIVGGVRRARPAACDQTGQMQRLVLCCLPYLPRRGQAPLDLGETSAERKVWQQPRLARRLQRGSDPLRTVLAMGARKLKSLRQLAGVLG